MQKRRKPAFLKVLLVVGVGLLISTVLASLVFIASQGWLNQLDPDWQNRANNAIATLKQQAHRFIPTGEQINFLIWLGGLAGGAISAAFALLASWHFADLNLPRRLRELSEALTQSHLAERPQLLALARKGLGTIPPNPETSRLSHLRAWIGGWTEKGRARILAASVDRLANDAAALTAAVSETQHRQITSRLIRGYHFEAEGDDARAFEEFDAATRINRADIASRDIAAGRARRLNNQKRELELLKEIQEAAKALGLDQDFARALRREAELLEKRKTETHWCEARDKLNEARRLLRPLIDDEEARVELGRVLTCFCEVQCSRTKIGRLEGPNGPLTIALQLMANVDMHRHEAEEGGEIYGDERTKQVRDRIAELRDDTTAGGETPDDQ